MKSACGVTTMRTPLSQKNHRVVYYETLGEPNPDARSPTVDWDEGGWPIGGFDCESGPPRN